MFEYTITSFGNQKLMEKLFKILQNKFMGTGALIIREQILNYHHISIAINGKTEFACGVIIESICESILFNYKVSIFETKIVNISNIETRYKLIAALSNFDNETDIQTIKKEIPLSENKINITSFYHFKLKKLKTKWLEICKIVNENIEYMNDKNVLNELLKAFSENKKNNLIHIYAGKASIKISIDDGASDLIFEYKQNFVDDIITEVISINPKKIIFHGDMSKIKKIDDVLSKMYNTVHID